MEASKREIELYWIKDVLERRGGNMQMNFIKSIREQKLIRSGNLLKSLGYNVQQPDDANAILSAIFATYGRIQDAGLGKTKKKPKRKKKEDEFLLLGTPRTKRIRRPWYVRNLYGELDRIIYEIIYGLDQETKDIIREKLQNSYTNGTQ